MKITDQQKIVLRVALIAKPSAIAVSAISAVTVFALAVAIVARAIALKSFNPASGINIASYVFAGLALAALAVLSISLVVRSRTVKAIIKTDGDLDGIMSNLDSPRISLRRKDRRERELLLGFSYSLSESRETFVWHNLKHRFSADNDVIAVPEDASTAFAALKSKAKDDGTVAFAALFSAALDGNDKISDRILCEALKFYNTEKDFAYAVAFSGMGEANKPLNSVHALLVNTPDILLRPVEGRSIASKMFDVLAQKAEAGLCFTAVNQ